MTRRQNPETFQRPAKRFTNMSKRDQGTVGDYIAALGRGDAGAVQAQRPKYRATLKRNPKPAE